MKKSGVNSSKVVLRQHGHGLLYASIPVLVYSTKGRRRAQRTNAGSAPFNVLVCLTFHSLTPTKSSTSTLVILIVLRWPLNSIPSKYEDNL